jgi:hypothetical protein
MSSERGRASRVWRSEGAELEALERQCCDAADQWFGEQAKLRHSSHFRDGT